MTLNIIKIAFKAKSIKILSYFTQGYNERHNITLRNLKTSSGLLILLHDTISLPDATSCNNKIYRAQIVMIIALTIISSFINESTK